MIEADDRVGELRRRVGGEHVFAGREMHAFDRRGGRDDRQAVAHCQIDLALDAGAVAERRDRDPAAVEIRRDVGNVARNHEIGRRKRLDRRGHHAADDDRAHPRQPLAQQRQNLARIPQHGVGVRRMLEAADEHEALALGERLPRRQQLVNRREHHDARFGQELLEQRFFGRAYDQCHVGFADQRQLLVALESRRGLRRRTALQLRQPFLAQKMQVDGVEYAKRMRRKRAHRLDVLDRDVVARHHDHVELGTPHVEQRGNGLRATSAPNRPVESGLAASVDLVRICAGGQQELGVIRLRQGDIAGARTALEIALKLRPDLPQTHYQLGLVYARLGMTEQAKTQTEIYQQLHQAANDKLKSEILPQSPNPESDPK